VTESDAVTALASACREVYSANVTIYVLLGKNYVLESSDHLKRWIQGGPQFTAQAETITQESAVDVVVRSYRIQQVP
jgi:hypothetical protein